MISQVHEVVLIYSATSEHVQMCHVDYLQYRCAGDCWGETTSVLLTLQLIGHNACQSYRLLAIRSSLEDDGWFPTFVLLGIANAYWVSSTKAFYSCLI
jgi:hypothetical protein